jgi:hypothetical protein
LEILHPKSFFGKINRAPERISTKRQQTIGQWVYDGGGLEAAEAKQSSLTAALLSNCRRPALQSRNGTVACLLI